MDNLKIEGIELNNTLQIIDKDIQNIKEILNNINTAMNSFDETTWKSPEKDKIDTEYLPYLKKACEKIPANLEKNLNFIKKALTQYKNLDTNLSQKISNETEVL